MANVIYSLGSLRSFLKRAKPSQVCVVTSKTLLLKLGWALREIGVPQSHVITIPDGEKAKTWDGLEFLLKRFSTLQLDRSSVVVALGGGSVGDVTGFATSIYLRGIRYIQVPTTLLAQVDSAHGGKTAINFLRYKNKIGSFHLPLTVVVDSRFLKTLSREQVADGLGEVIKAGFIKDPSILQLLEKHTLDTLKNSPDMERIVKKSIAAKEYFIRADYKDGDTRQILNVGHTLGHAIELKFKMGHGTAVIVGMLQEFALTEKASLTLPSVRTRLVKLLSHLGIDTSTQAKASWQSVIHDKKVSGAHIILPVVIKEGSAVLHTMKLSEFRKYLSV